MKKLILILAASALLLAGCEESGGGEPNNNPYSRSAKKTTESLAVEKPKTNENKKASEVQKTTPEAEAQVTEAVPVTAPDIELPVQGAQQNEQSVQTEENTSLQEAYENQVTNDEVIELPVIPIE